MSFLRTFFIRLPLLFIGATTIAGCALNAGVQQPEFEAPDAWSYAEASEALPPSNWWKNFSSSELNEFVRRALMLNLDLAAAAARLEKAEAQVTISGAELWPSVSLSGSASRSGILNKSGSTQNYQAGVAASYELDVWGGNRAARRSATANYAAAAFDQDAVRTTVVAAVVTTYLDVLSLRQRISLAKDNLNNAEKVLAVVQSRYTYGASSSLELSQQQAQVAGQRAALPLLIQQERERRAALAVLLGVAPQNFVVQGESISELTVPPTLATMPSQVLMRRPDVQQADAKLQAAEANVVAARAALFPSLSIGASLGWENNYSAQLFNGDPAWNLVGSVSQALFQGGRLKATTKAARASYDELAANYVQTILSALSEADAALSNVNTLKERGRWQIDQETYSSKSYELAKTQYQAGSVDLLTVLYAQVTLFNNQDAVLQNRVAQMQSLVTLYRVLGAVPEDISHVTSYSDMNTEQENVTAN